MPLNIDWQQILLHMFNFVLLMGGMYFLLYKPVKSFMDKRTEYYKELDSKAKDDVEEAQRMKKLYSDQLEKAQEEIRQQNAEMTASAKVSAEKIISEAEQQRESILKQASSEAVKEKERIIATAKTEIADIAVLAAKKILDDSETSKEVKENE